MQVLVTGGARRIGAAIVRAVAAAGCRPVVHHHASADEALALARETGGVTVGGDLAEPGDLFARACRAAGAPIDGLVNCASLFEEDRADAIDPRLAHRLYAVNCVAPAVLTAALAAQGRDGAVVNVLDQKLANPNPDFFSYSLTKFALAGATTMMAQAYAPRIRVNAVSPGLTLPSGDQGDDDFARVACRNLLRREVGVENVAAAVVYLLQARSTTGQNLFVDAGQRFVRSDRDVMFEGRADG